MGRGLVLALLLGAALLAPASAAADPSSDFLTAKRGVWRAVAAGRLAPDDAGADAAVAYRAARAVRLLPGAPARNLAYVLHEVAAEASFYTAPRATTLFSMLEVNTRVLAHRSVPTSGADVVDDDGVVYRAFAGRGLQFHPLANFARLNSLVAAHDDRAPALADALLERAVDRGGALTWEYHFPFGGGRAPWLSGMVQAVAAQALARAGLPDEATRAFLAVPRLQVTLPAGPWTRLYSFAGVPVLNAQLQAVLSVADYAEIADDAAASALDDRMRAAAAALLPRFDTGYWSLYGLGWGEAALRYHRYVISLLSKLAARYPEEPVWADYADRFARDLELPPLVRVSRATRGRVAFWLSKVSFVTVRTAGGTRTVRLRQGFHLVTWRPRRRATSVTAVDLAGNRATVSLGS